MFLSAPTTVVRAGRVERTAQFQHQPDESVRTTIQISSTTAKSPATARDFGEPERRIELLTCSLRVSCSAV